MSVILKDFTISIDDNGITRLSLTCGVCKGVFPVKKSMHYISRDKNVTGLNIIVKKDEPILYDSYDCSICGCQNLVQERKYDYHPYNEFDEKELEDAENE